MSTALPAVSRLANGNWGRIALDLARAIVIATGSAETVVMWTVLEESWFGPWFSKGPGEEAPTPIPVTLNIAQLARQTARHPQNLRAARTKLVASGLLIDTPSGLLPSKDYTAWTDPATGYPMLDAAQLQHCLAALELPARFRKSAPKTGELKSSHAKKGGEQKHSLRIVGCEQKSSHANAGCEQKHSPEIQPPQTPLISSRASEDLIQMNSEEEEREKATPPPIESAPKPGPGLSRSQRERMEEGQRPGDIEPDPELFELAQNLIVSTWDNHNLANQLKVIARTYPSAWLVKVVKKLALKKITLVDKSQPNLNFLTTILKGWADNGQPKPGPEDDFDDAMNPIPFSQRGTRTPQAPAQRQSAPLPACYRPAKFLPQAKPKGIA